MTPELASQIHDLRAQAHIKRGAAHMALTAGDDLAAADLHLEAQTYEAAADELAKDESPLAAESTHDPR